MAEDKWMQRASEEMERKGTKGSFGKATRGKIAKGKKAGGKKAKKAQFAEMAKKFANKRKKKRGGGRGM